MEGIKDTSKDEVSFVTSDYELDVKTTEVLQGIVTESKQTAKVLIATSVLDNGVSIKDLQLRNIIIVADTQIEFLQMLGRKRDDGQPIKLYIYKHKAEHFIRRKRINDRRLEIAEKYYNVVEKQVECANTANRETIHLKEAKVIYDQHKKYLNDLMKDKGGLDDLRTIFMSLDGVLILNKLSVKNLQKLDQYYIKLKKKFEKYGEDAFLREQLLWLGKTDEEIEIIISDANKSKYDLSRERVIRELNRICDKNMSQDEFLAFKNSISSDLVELVEYVGKENSQYKSYISLCKKNERPISSKFMEYLRINCDIPFVIKHGSYTVTRAKE